MLSRLQINGRSESTKQVQQFVVPLVFPLGWSYEVQGCRCFTGGTADALVRACTEPSVEDVHAGDREVPDFGANSVDDAITDVELLSVLVVADVPSCLGDSGDRFTPFDSGDAGHLTLRAVGTGESFSASL